MNLDIDYFKTIQGTLGCKNLKEAKINEIRKQFQNGFDTSINVEYDVLRNGNFQDFIITPKKDGSCNIKPRVNEKINVGDIIFWNDIHWLTVEKEFQDGIYNNHIITKCNRTIKWQNPATKEIIERWCFCSQPYSSGVDDGTIINTLNGKYKIQLPYDEETRLIGVDKRFMFDVVNGIPEIYKVVFADRNTNKFQDITGGFIELILISDTPTDKDNEDLMVCDYVMPNQPPIPPTPNPTLLQCEILGRKDIKIGGSTRIYTAKFYKDDGNEDATVIPIWNLKVNPFYKDYIKYEQNGNLINITCLDNEDLIGETLTLELVDNNGLYQKVQIQIECVV